MRHLRTTLTVLGGLTVLVLAGNTVALATTGHSLILGQNNSANTYTTISRTTSGSVLSLKSSSSTNAPLSVNGSGKVANLNADKLDGYDSPALLNKTTLFETAIDVSAASGFALSTPELPAGDYAITAKGFIYGPTSGGTFINCYVRFGDPLIEQVLAVQADGYYTVNISGVLSTSAPAALSLQCDGPSGGYSSYAPDPVQISVTPIGSLVHTSFATGRVRAPRTSAVH